MYSALIVALTAINLQPYSLHFFTRCSSLAEKSHFAFTVAIAFVPNILLRSENCTKDVSVVKKSRVAWTIFLHYISILGLTKPAKTSVLARCDWIRLR